jgi:hypothetical protein
VRRHGPTLLVLGLLVATGVAFVVAERVKLETSPIRGPSVDPVFSPVCECPNRVDRIVFRLSRPDTLGVGVVDAGGRLVRSLVRDRPYPALHRLEFEWDGRDGVGRLVPEGLYRPRVHFAVRDRTIVLPNTMRVDTTPPTVSVRGVRPRVISPDGDGRAEGVAVRYRVNEAARALLLVDGSQRVRGRLSAKLRGQLQWYGRVAGRSLPAGVYRLSILAEDRAGNLSRPVPAGNVRVRYIELAPRRIEVRRGARFRVVIDTDARRYIWRFAGREGVASERALVLHARRPGRYGLVVEESGHRARALVVVTRR